MVRVYANLMGLSKALARAKLAGHEARSISPFTSSFTRSQDLFDFVDAGDKKENADFKIRGIGICSSFSSSIKLIVSPEMFRLFADNSQCKRIFFGGCHDVGYLSMLTPHQGNERITLIKGTGFNPEYYNLGLRIEEFQNVFRSAPLSGQGDPSIPFRGAPPNPRLIANGIALPKAPLSQTFKAPGYLGTSRWESPPEPRPSNKSSTFGSWRDNVTAALPAATSQTQGLIPINDEHQRIDTYIPKPSSTAFNGYNARARTQKLCNEHHLGGYCGNQNCDFDHSPITPEELHVMTYIVRDYPCPRKDQCRLKSCYYGHICAKDTCYGPGKGCRLNRAMHGIDAKVAEWVPGLEHQERPKQDWYLRYQQDNSRDDGRPDGRQDERDRESGGSSPSLDYASQTTDLLGSPRKPRSPNKLQVVAVYK